MQNDWVLHLDADEVVTPELRRALLAIASHGSRALSGLADPVEADLMGRWLRRSGMYPAYQVRFGRRDQLRFIDHGHGQREALPPNRSARSCSPSDHYNFSKGLDDWFARHRRYAAAEAGSAGRARQPARGWANCCPATRRLRRRALKRLANRLPFRPSLRFRTPTSCGRIPGWCGGLPLRAHAGHLPAFHRPEPGSQLRLTGKRVTAARLASRRVCFVNRYCYPDSSATSQLLTDLAGELSARGWQVTMIGCNQRYDDPAARLPVEDRWRGVEIRRVAGTRFGRRHLLGRAIDYASFYLGLVPTLWRILRRGDVVVAKTDPPLLGLVIGPLARLRGARTVNWLQDLFPEISVALGQPPHAIGIRGRASLVAQQLAAPRRGKCRNRRADARFPGRAGHTGSTAGDHSKLAARRRHPPDAEGGKPAAHPARPPGQVRGRLLGQPGPCARMDAAVRRGPAYGWRFAHRLPDRRRRARIRRPPAGSAELGPGQRPVPAVPPAGDALRLHGGSGPALW